MASKKLRPSPAVDPAVLMRVTDSMLYIDEQKAALSSDRSEYSIEAREAQIHPRVLAFMLWLLKQGPGDRHLALECFDAYRDALKLDAWQSEVDPQSDIEDAARAA